MNRRQLLAASLASSILACSRDSAQAEPNGKSVIVVGAGMAGISAAHDLRQKGYEVTVIEGRDRIGGRVWTSRAWPDIPLDLGASWIHGIRGNPLTRLADRIDAERVATDSDEWPVYGTDGKLESGMDRTWGTVMRDGRAAVREARKGDHDISVLEAVKSHVDLEAMSEQERLRFFFVLYGYIELSYASDVERTSALFLEDGRSFGGKDVVFPQGYDALVKHLAQGLDVHLNQKVAKLKTTNNAVTVLTENEEWNADYAVITLPIGVLKHGDVTFDPPLPPSKTEAIAQVGAGLLNKVALKFPHCFWEKKADWIGSISPEKGHFHEWLSLQRVFGQPVLIAFLGASFAREMEQQTNEATIAQAMQVLRRNYGRDIPEPVDSQITRWASDPFARCSYSSPTLGITSESRQQLAAPVNGRLFFAGEATSDYASTVHGAFLSGQRVAKEIQKQ